MSRAPQRCFELVMATKTVSLVMHINRKTKRQIRRLLLGHFDDNLPYVLACRLILIRISGVLKVKHFINHRPQLHRADELHQLLVSETHPRWSVETQGQID